MSRYIERLQKRTDNNRDRYLENEKKMWDRYIAENIRSFENVLKSNIEAANRKGFDFVILIFEGKTGDDYTHISKLMKEIVKRDLRGIKYSISIRVRRKILLGSSVRFVKYVYIDLLLSWSKSKIKNWFNCNFIRVS